MPQRRVRLPPPFETARMPFLILCHTGTVHITAPQHIDCLRIAGLRRLFKDGKRLFRILRHAVAGQIAKSQLEHGFFIALRCTAAQQLYRLFRILFMRSPFSRSIPTANCASAEPAAAPFSR